MLCGQRYGRLHRSGVSENAITDRVRANFEVKKMLSAAEHIGESPGAWTNSTECSQVFAYRCSAVIFLGYRGLRNYVPVLVGCRAAQVVGG